MAILFFPTETPALDEILKAHMVEGFMDTADVHDEDILESVNGLNIRMTVYNTYPQRHSALKLEKSAI